MVAAAALGAAGLAGGAAPQTTTPYEQSIGSATIDIVSGGKAFDLRGETFRRDSPKKLTLTSSASPVRARRLTTSWL